LVSETQESIENNRDDCPLPPVMQGCHVIFPDPKSCEFTVSCEDEKESKEEIKESPVEALKENPVEEPMPEEIPEKE